MHQAHGGFFPHALDAGDVVGGIPHKGLQVDHMDGIKPVALPESLRGHVLGGGLSHAGGDQLHLGMIGNQLEAVLVAGDQHALPACRLAFPGDGSQKIVGLPARQFIPGDVQGVQHLLQHRDLHPQFLRHGLPGGLVGRVRRVAEGGGVYVESHAEGVGPLFSRQPQKGGEKAEDGVGVKPVPGGEGTDAVIGAVEYAVAVNGHKFHGSMPS